MGDPPDYLDYHSQDKKRKKDYLQVSVTKWCGVRRRGAVGKEVREPP